jgi:hypothetical protein
MSTENIESRESTARAAALAALVIGQPVDDTEAPAPLTRTGREVECGGEIARLLVKPASTLGYRLPWGVYQRCGAVPGDVVLLPRSEADRLDALGVTVDPDTDLGDVQEQQADGLWTDDQIREANAEPLIAYVTQHPDERERVRALEEARKGRTGKPRATVLKATEVDHEAEATAQAEAEALAAATATGDPGDGSTPEDHGKTPDEVAEGQQGNDGGGTGE